MCVCGVFRAQCNNQMKKTTTLANGTGIERRIHDYYAQKARVQWDCLQRLSIFHCSTERRLRLSQPNQNQNPFSSRGSSSVVVDILHRLYIDDISCWEILKCYAAWRHNAFNHSTMYAGALHWGIISGLTLMMCWHYKIILIELSRLDHDCKEGRFDTCTHTRHWTSQWISFYKLPDTESR